MLIAEIIRRKRNGETLENEAVSRIVRGIADGTVSEGQAAAFAMAVFFKGMTRDETVALTKAMTDSGRRIDWSGADLHGPVLDKHSSGGVGDKVSLVLAPMLAACGAHVPMISGRGLGHTGGTLDKLESIPGYTVSPGLERFRDVVSDAGCAIVSADSNLAPADRRLYAIRDVTATVESLPLITASILSKKLAAGLGALVMDVKVGSGAFAPTPEEARALADSIVAVANCAGLPTRALITDMDQVLGHAAGNALEVRESLSYLIGAERDPCLHEVVLALGGELLRLGALADDAADARRRLERSLADGTAVDRFGRMVAGLGGPTDLVEHPDRHLAMAAHHLPVYAAEFGTVNAIDVRALGLAIIGLGGGRQRPDDAIDPAVGLSDVRKIGDVVDREQPLAIVHAASLVDAEAAAGAVRDAFSIGEHEGGDRPVVRETVTVP